MSKNICLKKITITNWRGKTASFFFGQHNVITGHNKSGKSLIKNAFFWLLTGADEDNLTNYKLFDDSQPQTFDNKKTARVEAMLTIDDIEFTLAREATPGWIRERGSETYKKKPSDDYSFYVNGISYSATSYKEFIEESIAPIDSLKLMLNTKQYLLLDWKDLRKFFEKIAGDITLDKMNGDYSSIKDLLNFHNNTDAIRTALKSEINPLVDVIGTPNSKGTLRVKIDTLKENLPDISNYDEWVKKEEEARIALNAIRDKLFGASEALKPYLDKRVAELNEIERLKQEYYDKRRNYETGHLASLNDLTFKIQEIDKLNGKIKKENEQLQLEYDSNKKKAKELEEQIDKLNNRREELLSENKKIKSLVFTDYNCPYCGQELPADRIEKAKSNFLTQKQARHDEIVTEGKANNAKIMECKEQLLHLRGILSQGINIQEYIDKLELIEELEECKKKFTEYIDTAEGKALNAIIDEKKQHLTVIPVQDNTVLHAEEAKLIDIITECEVNIARKKQYQEQCGKINILENEFKANAARLVNLEGKLAKVDEYEREYANIIKEVVSGMFDFCHITMTEPKKNGGLVNTCIIKDDNNINARVTNTADKILCGIYLSLGFQRYYDISLPLFIDDSDLINSDRLPTINGQTMLISVTPGDLKIEDYVDSLH